MSLSLGRAFTLRRSLIACLWLLLPLVAAPSLPQLRAAGPPLPLAEACTTDNPYLAVPQYVMTGGLDQAALVAFHASPDGRSEHEVLATQAQIGPTWGVGVDGAAQTLYAGAFHKRATAFGPAGPGGIYRVDLSAGDVAEWTRVPDSGADAHGPVAVSYTHLDVYKRQKKGGECL